MKITEKAISFVPTPLLEWITAGKSELRFQAVVAFADVSGFTNMSEKLATIGKEGAEALTAILNRYFTEMISRIEVSGGFVGKFGGDAMTIFFPLNPGEELHQVGLRAVTTSLDLQKKMSEFQNVETKAGMFSLGMKIGVAAGDVFFRVVGPDADGGKEYLLAGLPLDRAAEAEHHGKSGQVVITPKLAGLCSIYHPPQKDGFILLDPSAPCPEMPTQELKTTIKENWGTIARYFIDPAVYKRMALGMDSVGEIRRASVIFMAFKGLNYDVDEQVGEKLEEVYDWVYALTKRYGGSINKVDMGDKGSKFIITFGTPTAHENNEALAVHCGLELVKGNDKLRVMGLEQKLGIASGVVFAGEVGAPSRQEYTVMGSVVNLSARLMAYSKPGQLLIDEATRERAGIKFEFSQSEAVKFKGIQNPVPVYNVLGLTTKTKRSADSDLQPLVGRRAEVEKSNEVLAEVEAGSPRVLLIRGEAGVGKSRLAQEVLSITKGKKFIAVGGEALSYAKRSPYLIWISILRRMMGLPSAGGGEDALGKITATVNSIDPEHSFRVPIIAGLLGVPCEENDITKHFDAQLRQENLFDFMVQYFRNRSAKSPLLLVFEDAQWIDRNSLELLSYLLRNLSEQRILYLYIRRPYSRNFTSPHIGEIEKNPITIQVDLTELNREETETLALQRLSADHIDQGLMEFIFESSHGNASFALQLIENLKSLQRLRVVREADDKGVLVEKIGDLSDVEVPDSLSSLIMSQLDRLPPVAKVSVKLAAAIGRQFQEEIVNGSYPIEITRLDIKKSLEELESNDIISSIADADIYDYIFKNLLTRDVAYDSLLFAHRREYHRRIGSCLEEIYQNSLPEWYDDLARHFSQSDDDDRAVKYLWKAGDKAYDLYANETAEDYYTKALNRAPFEKYRDRRYRLLLMRSKVYAVIGKSDLQKKDLDEILDIAASQHNPQGQVDTLGTLARYYYRAHDLKEMKRVIDEAMLLLDDLDYPFGRFNINDKIAIWHFVQNKHDEALHYWETCLKDAEATGDLKGLSVAYTNCGLAYKAKGNFDQALEYYNRSVEIDRQVGNKKSEAVNLGNIGVLYQQRGDAEHAAEVYKQALEIARGIGSKQIQSYYLGNLATIYQTNGEREQALASHKELLDIAMQIGFHRSQVASLSNIGNWYMESGDSKQAKECFDRALEIARKHGLRATEPQIIMNMGWTAYYQGDLTKAEELLTNAVNLSVDVKNKPAEDYSRRYLGFVLIDIGKIKEAREMFQLALENAVAVGSKNSIASAKVGLGYMDMCSTGDRKLLDEGLSEAFKLKDAETVIKGQVLLAKGMLKLNHNLKEIQDILGDVLENAQKSGYLNEVAIIRKLFAETADRMACRTES